MQTVALNAIQNQQFTITLDGDFYQINVYFIGGGMFCDITRNGIVLCTTSRIIVNGFLIPFFAYEGTSGNFLLLTQNDDIADYTQFGTTQTLMYLSFNDIAAAVA